MCCYFHKISLLSNNASLYSKNNLVQENPTLIYKKCHGGKNIYAWSLAFLRFYYIFLIGKRSYSRLIYTRGQVDIFTLKIYIVVLYFVIIL